MSDKKWIKKSEKNLEEIERATENFQIEKVYQSKLELSSLGVYGKKKFKCRLLVVTIRDQNINWLDPNVL